MVSSMSLVLAIVTIFTISMSVKADDALIRTLCDKMDFPAICRDCFNSDGAGHLADQVGLTKISIKCAVRSSKLFSDDMHDMWNTTSSPQDLKDVLYRCWLGAKTANKIMRYAKAFIDHDHDDFHLDYAIGMMYNSIPHLSWCVEAYEKNLPGTPVPELIRTETAVVDQDAGIAVRLLTYLLEGK